MGRLIGKTEKITFTAIGTIIAVGIIMLIFLTQTDWGRRNVLTFGLNQLAKRVHGHVTIAEINGNLLSGARLHKVVITDTAGRPFLNADTVTLRYSLTSLLRKHLVLNDVRIVNAFVVLDQPPGEEWNFVRLFPTGPPKPHRGPGFGSWVVINNMTVRNTHAIVRATRKDADTASTNRMWVVKVPGGYQSVSEFINVNGRFPVMRLADPDSSNRLITVESLSTLALPFKPPAVDVKSLSARFVITKDSLYFDSVRVRTPTSRASGLGAYALNGSGARVQLNIPQANIADARFLMPTAPAGRGKLLFAFTSHNGANHIIASEMDMRVEGATVKGRADIQIGNAPFRVGPSDVTYANLDTRLVKRYMPSAPLNAVGTLAGHMRLAGDPASMRVDGWTNYTERGGPTSRVVADGVVGNSNGVFVARGLRLRLQPLHLSLVRKYKSGIPYTGAVTGTAVLTGSTRSGFALNADIYDADPRNGRSHLRADGRVDSRDGFTARQLHLRFDPLQVAMLKAFAPKIPYGGTIAGTTTLTGSMKRGFSVDADVTHNDPRYGRSHVGANGRVAFNNGIRADRLKLRFDPLQVDLAKPYVKNLPYSGTLTGTTTLTGSQRTGFDVVADLFHNSKETGRSHVTANGWVAITNGISMRALRLGFEPLQMAVARPFIRDLPIDGTLAGRATVTGSLASKRIASIIDLTHNGSGGTSRFIGRANANWAGVGSFDVDVRTPVLSLATVGQVVPSAGLRGSASGGIEARGTMSNLRTDVNLAFANNGGTMHTVGMFDLQSSLKKYDFTSTFTAFNGAQVTSHLPQTALTGTVVARGFGTTLETANASINANLIGSRAAGSPLVDTALVQARLTSGLLTVDRGHVRLGSALGDFNGSFGLTASRSGTLRYAFAVDTVSQFLAHVQVDTGFVQPRPLNQQRRILRARADSVRIADATEVQRMAVGYPPPPRLKLDTLPTRRDTLSGSLRAEGTLTGNVKVFDAKGTAQAKSLTFGGNHVGRGNASYDIRGFGSNNASFHLLASGDTVDINGFAFDSARAKIDYTGLKTRGNGSVDIAAFQDPERDYRIRSDFNLSLEQKQLAIQDLALRFDTTHWTTTHPATISWGKPGTIVSGLELRSNAGGSMRVDGRLPTNGPADLRLDIDKLQLGDVSALVQDTGNIQGVLGLHAHVQGTARAPVMAGDVTVVKATYRGQQLPDISSRLSYANGDLRFDSRFMRDSTLLATADAHLPVNLALQGVTGPRLNRSAPLRVEMRMDSLPLESLPSFTTAVSDVRGRVRGNAVVSGTFNDPQVNGLALLDLGSLRVNASGVLYNNIGGQIQFKGQTAYIDSIVAHAGGTVRTTGTIGFATLARPEFDLTVKADDAWLLDSKRGNFRADAALAIKGPYTGVHITGDVNVNGGVFYAPETKNQHVTNLDDPTLRGQLDTVGLGLQILPPPNPFMRGLLVDVGVRISPNTWARNTAANVEIYTPDDREPLTVHMDNAHQVLTLSGVINTDRGEYSVAGRSFKLSTGSATFIPGPKIDPLIQLTARYQVQRQGLEALIIEVHIDGFMTAPRVTLTSNSQPPLAQSDMLAYLAFGQPTSSLLNLQSSGIGSAGNGGLSGLPALAEQQLASVAIGASMDELVRQIEQEGSRGGLDVFRVRAGEMPAEAAFQGYFRNFLSGTEIEAGKYVTDRMFVTVQGRVNTTPGVSLQYRAPNGLQWSGVFEPRYLPVEPSFSSAVTAQRARTLGVLVLWNRRF